MTPGEASLAALAADIRQIPKMRRWGAVSAVRAGVVEIAGFPLGARTGEAVRIETDTGSLIRGEIIAVWDRRAAAMTYDLAEGVAAGDRVEIAPDPPPRPSAHWIGETLDAFGRRADDSRPPSGPAPARLRAPPPDAHARRRLGPRLGAGLAPFDTLLPIVQGQRIGLFAGSGVGKTTLLADLAKGVEADVVVLALIGERGRELRAFIEDALGPEGMARAVVIAATADQSPLIKRRAAHLAMATAEHFRDEGRHVLLLVDSLTRYAEAHREIALSAGEAASLRAYPPSTASMIGALLERAGPGVEGAGDITGIFSVLVAGSDMEEPVADMARGALDGHVILDRAIAERGRFPAVDFRRSVSRSLPEAATPAENALIARARALTSAYEDAAPMIRAGLYAPGSDPEIDAAIAARPALEAFMALRAPDGPEQAFAALEKALSDGSEGERQEASGG